MTDQPGSGRSTPRGAHAPEGAPRSPGGSPILHPLAFALYPILALLAANLQELDAAEAVRPLLLAVLAAVLLLGVLRLILGDWHRAGLATSVILLIFFSYGHVYTTLERLSPPGFSLGRHRYLLPISLALIAGLLAWLWRRRPDLRRGTIVLNVVGGALLLFPLATIATTVVRAAIQGQSFQPTETVRLSPAEDEPLPDIYYIILDSYARADYMQGLFGYDNSEFIDFLESRGFYVADQSHANHNWTGYSLSSSLNLEYVQDLGLQLSPHSYPWVASPAIRDSLVRQALEQAGYQSVALQTGWGVTEITDADQYLVASEAEMRKQRRPIMLTRFETQLVQTSMVLALSDLNQDSWERWTTEFGDLPYSELRTIVLSAFTNLPLAADDPRPQFVFAHIMSPHKPFVFGPQGEPRDPTGAFTFANTVGDSTEIPAYRDQAVFVTKQIELAIDEILRTSEIPPILILQADHGYPWGDDEWQSEPGRGVPQRTAILNAYLLPQRCRSMLYPTITPVNTFRVVFNCQFGTSLAMLEDRIFYTLDPRQDPTDIVDVTDRVGP